MIWNVYVRRPNTNKIEPYNIFNHAGFKKQIEEAFALCETKEEFVERLKIELRYYFWSKCEWEIILTDWPTHVSYEEVQRLNQDVLKHVEQWGKRPYAVTVNLKTAEKVDVYDQVMLNWEPFVDYVWSSLFVKDTVEKIEKASSY